MGGAFPGARPHKPSFAGSPRPGRTTVGSSPVRSMMVEGWPGQPGALMTPASCFSNRARISSGSFRASVSPGG
jgi:hypothetical protein